MKVRVWKTVSVLLVLCLCLLPITVNAESWEQDGDRFKQYIYDTYDVLPEHLDQAGIIPIEICEYAQYRVYHISVGGAGEVWYQTRIGACLFDCPGMERFYGPGIYLIGGDGVYTLEEAYQAGVADPLAMEGFLPAVTEKCGFQYAIFGDMDQDSLLTVKDVTLLQKHLAEVTPVTCERLLELADFDGGGTVDICDVTAIQKYIAGSPAVI